MKKNLLIAFLTIGSFTSQAQLPGNWSPVDSIPIVTANGFAYYVSAVDVYTCWTGDIVPMQGASREFSRTTDGGVTWTSAQITTSPASLSISGIYARTANRAWATFYGNPGGGAVYYTADGGTTWNKQTSAAYTSASFADFTTFFNDTDGVSFGDPVGTSFEVYTTTDGGANWTVVPAANIAAPIGNEYGLTNVYCKNGNTVWAGTTAGRIIRSTDKGYTWTALTTNQPNTSYIDAVAFADDFNGLAISHDDQGAFLAVIKTDDGGATWTTITTGQTDVGGIYQPGHVAYVPGTTGSFILCAANQGDAGSSITTDYGATFTNIDVNAHLFSDWQSTSIGWSTMIDVQTGTPGACYWSSLSSVPSIASENAGNIFPNPAKDNLTISLKNKNGGDVVISVLDITGKIVLTQEYATAEVLFNRTIDVSTLSGGCYIVKVDANNTTSQSKLIVQ